MVEVYRRDGTRTVLIGSIAPRTIEATRMEQVEKMVCGEWAVIAAPGRPTSVRRDDTWDSISMRWFSSRNRGRKPRGKTWRKNGNAVVRKDLLAALRKEHEWFREALLAD